MSLLHWKAIAFSWVPLIALVSATAYTLYFVYRWRDWRPLLFVVVLVAMGVHQTNELVVIYQTGSIEIVDDFGEYPETTANLSASLAVVLILRIVARERELSDRLRVQLRRERALKERQRELEQFASAASHDLREPLRVISNYLQLLERRYAEELDEDGRRYVGYAVDASARMQGLIEGLLAYSRIEQRGGAFEPTDVSEVLERAESNLELAIEHSGAEISAEELPTVEGDPNQLMTVFQNLLDNAIAYSGEEPPRVDVSVREADHEWEFAVADRGIGMDPDEADRAFTIFERLHADGGHPTGNEGGTGIGLALCERIVNRHGGEIRIETERGEGTVVRFTLPKPGEGRA